MLLEASSYIRNRHHCTNESEWKFLGRDTLDPNGEYESDFFPGATVEAVVGDEGGSTIVFLEDPKGHLHGKHIKHNGVELVRGGEVLFPAVVNEGEGIEIYNSYKSMDIDCMPIVVNQTQQETPHI